MIAESQSDAASIPEYLRRSEKPLILYGMGKCGIRAYRKIKSLGIRIDAIVDGDVGKQHTFVDDLEILSPENAIQEYMDAIFLITVEQPGVAAEIEKNINKDGMKRETIIYNVALFHNLSLPFVIFGTNRLARAVRRQLDVDNLEFRGYLSLEEEEVMGFSDNQIVSLQELAQSKGQVNIILCEKEQGKVAWYLQKYNLMENCFQGYDASFGFFRADKYEPRKAIVRDLLYSHLCALNKLYYGFSDNASRRVFAKICHEFFHRKRTLSVTEYMNIVKEKACWGYESFPAELLAFDRPARSVKEFLRFISLLDKLITDFWIENVKLQETNGTIIVTYSKEGKFKNE